MALAWSWQRANVAASLWCIAVGIAMMTLWLSEPAGLAAHHPSLFGMKFNAALAFLVVGAALGLIARGHRRLPALMMAPVFLYGALALSQHLFGIDVGIDTLLHTPFVDIGTSLPGRIAPNTALCLMLVSLAVALRALAGRNGIVQVALGFLTFIIAAAALIGYAISLDFAHDWIRFTRMSFQSASCFVAVSIALIFVGTETAGYQRVTLAAMPALTSARSCCEICARISIWPPSARRNRAPEPGLTIWPTSTLRSRISPLAGARTSSLPISARVALSCAWFTRTWAFAASRAARLASISAFDTKPRP